MRTQYLLKYLMSNQAIYYNLLNIYFSSLIDLDTLIIMSPKIDAPYLWIGPWDLVPLNLAYRLLWIIMDRLYIPVIILHLSIVAKKKKKNNILLQRSNKNSSTAYVILYELIDTWFWDSNRRVGVWLLPWRWHILSIPLTTGRGTGAETCRLDDVFPPDDLCSRPEALCLYIYMHFVYELCYRTYNRRIYTYNRSVIQYWWSWALSHSIGQYF